LDADVRDPIPHYMTMLDKVHGRAEDFDILDFHIDYLHFPLFRSERSRTLATLQGRQDLADHMPFYRRFPDMPLVSISNPQRAPLPGVNSLPLSITDCRSSYTSLVSIDMESILLSWLHFARRNG
jgi:hypothetical protein